MRAWLEGCTRYETGGDGEVGSKSWWEACVVGCMRWGVAGAWRCWAEVKESARAFESDLDGGGGRSSSGDGGARMRRGRGLTEAGERARVRRGWDGSMWGEECSVKRKPQERDVGLTGGGAGGRQASVGSRWVKGHDDGDGQAREMRGRQ